MWKGGIGDLLRVSPYLGAGLLALGLAAAAHGQVPGANDPAPLNPYYGSPLYAPTQVPVPPASQPSAGRAYIDGGTAVSRPSAALILEVPASPLVPNAPAKPLILDINPSTGPGRVFLDERPGQLPDTAAGPTKSPLILEGKPTALDEVIPSGYDFERPIGYTGNSSVLPRTGGNADFLPVEDRWRIGAPYWDRYGLGFPLATDYPYRMGSLLDPYNQNILKGDYPIIGQHTFLKMSAILSNLFEFRQLPTATTPFESTARPFETDFFGKPNQFFWSQTLLLSFDLFHGDTTAFKPFDWRVKLTPAFNVNTLSVQELGVVSPDITDGTVRNRGWATMQEYFVETKLADLSPQYDFVSARVGSQPFTSDFRGFIFSDINRAARLFGTLNGNQDQFNLIFFRQAEKDTNSGLNGFKDRNQNIAIANWYHQDFLFPGYTVQGSVHYNDDGPSFLFDRNKFLVRPDPVGVFQPHRVQAVYLGFAGDGHIDRFNVSHAFYWALGHDSRNPMASQPTDINGKMAALELSYDRDWARFRVSGFYQSGDGNPNDGHATGFDSILDNVNFAGSEFSYWGRQNIPLFGVNLTNRNSLFADLRSSKIQGQSNFVNPGLWIVNAGVDFDVTPKLRSVNNANFMWFDKTAVLSQFTFQGAIDREIGLDLSSGIEYRPLLSNNIIMLMGAAVLLPSNGFKQLYNGFGATGSSGSKVDPLFSVFAEVVLAF